ncbi:MAG: hypothetical protein K9H61_06100 [Bacteroidia bacterium]|nr:hypothetical protein [Bacteroidia bacterium]MCF8446550.1 hypothetical protein [Bacteroidia bacterium]
MKHIEKLNSTYAQIYERLQNDEANLDQEIYDLDREVKDYMETTNGNEHMQLKGLLIKILAMKKEFDIYDEESELDRMFPERHEEGFDEDSMSYDSVIGDE